MTEIREAPKVSGIETTKHQTYLRDFLKFQFMKKNVEHKPSKLLDMDDSTRLQHTFRLTQPSKCGQIDDI